MRSGRREVPRTEPGEIRIRRRHWPQRLIGEAEATFAIESLDLVEGTYKLDVAIHKIDGFPYDYHRLLYTFRVKSRIHDVGIYRPRHHWTFSPTVVFKKPLG